MAYFKNHHSYVYFYDLHTFYDLNIHTRLLNTPIHECISVLYKDTN